MQGRQKVLNVQWDVELRFLGQEEKQAGYGWVQNRRGLSVTDLLLPLQGTSAHMPCLRSHAARGSALLFSRRVKS